MSHSNTRRNIIIGLAISLVFVGIFIWYSFSNIRQASHKIRAVNATLTSLRALEAMMDDIQDIESGQRGYMILGKKELLTHYNNAIQNLQNDTQAVHSLYTLHPERIGRYNELLRLLRQKISISQNVVDIRTNYGADSSYNSLKTGVGEQLMDSIRSIVTALEIQDRAILREANASRSTAARTTVKLFASLAAIFIACILFLFWRIDRTQTRKTAYEKRIAYLAGLTEKTSDAFFSLDLLGNIVSWNKAAENIFGYSKAEAIGKPAAVITGSDATAEYLSVIKSALTKGASIERESISYNKKGNAITGLYSITALTDDNDKHNGYVIVFRDISEQKKAADLMEKFNQELSRQVEVQTELLKNILERVSDGFSSVDENWNFTYINKTGAQLLGKQPHEIIGRQLWEIFPEAVNSPIYKSYTTALRQQQNIEVEFYYPPLGKWFVQHIYPSPNGLSVFFRDVTDQKKIVEEISKSNERFQIISRATSDIVWEWDILNGNLWWNDNYYSHLGYKKTAEIVSISEWYDRIHPEEISRVRTGIKNVFEGDGPVWRENYQFINAAGEYLHFMDRGFIIRDDAGRAIRMIGSMVDMSLVYKAQKELVESENRLRTILETDPECIKLLNKDCTVADINPAGLKLIEVDNKEDVLGTSLLPIVAKEQSAAAQQLVSNAFDGKSGRLEYEVITFKGTHRWCEMNVVPFRNSEGQIVHALSVTRDISERKKTEAALRYNEEKYRTVIEQAVDAIALYNEEGEVLDINTGAANLLGYSKEELTGMKLTSILTMDELQDNPIRYDELQHGNSTIKVRKMRRKDGSIVETEVRSQQLSDGRFLSVIRDLTERLRAEKDLAASYEAIRKLTSHIQDVREEERTSMAREIHDELGQLLTVLKMDISWLSKKFDTATGDVKEKLSDLLGLIDKTVGTVRKISSELRPTLLDDLGLIAAMEWHLEEFEKRSGIKKQLEAPNEELQISDSLKIGLFRIFQESLTNVARHSGADTVNVSLVQEDNRIVLKIADNGKGFDKNQTSSETLGVLGMKERTLMMGGKYHIIGIPGQGTTVEVMIPVPELNQINN